MVVSVMKAAPPMTMMMNGKPRMHQEGDRRLSLLYALTKQTISRSQQGVQDLVRETVKYVNSSRAFGSPRSIEEAFMTVPDLETIPYRPVKRTQGYEIRQVESYVVAETSMPSEGAFDFMGSAQAFNTIAAYLFGKNARKQEMEMTTPVLTNKDESPCGWKMAFVMPSEYAERLPEPTDNSVRLRRVPAALVAVIAFSGFVTQAEVNAKEQQLRLLLRDDPTFRVKPFARASVAQYNPPFTPPLFRRNELLLEVEVKPIDTVIHTD